MQHVQWIFFDVGSTLVDEQKAYDHRAREMLRGTGISFETFHNARVFYAKQGKNGDAEAIRRFSLTKTPWPSQLEEPYPDTEPALRKLQAMGYKLGIIANQNPGTGQRLERWGLGCYFRVIAASAELGVAKPQPEIFLAALEMAGCRPEEALMVGDRLDNDILPARMLGMHTAWIRKGLAVLQENQGADLVLDNLHQLPQLLTGKDA